MYYTPIAPFYIVENWGLVFMVVSYHIFSKKESDKVTENLPNAKYNDDNKQKGAAIMAAMNINTNQFQELMKNDKPILVDFWAPWCTYCRRIGPAYDRVATQYSEEIEVVKVNIDEEPGLAQQERIEVIPTLVLYHKGEALGSIVAPDSKAMIDSFLQETREQ